VEAHSATATPGTHKRVVASVQEHGDGARSDIAQAHEHRHAPSNNEGYLHGPQQNSDGGRKPEQSDHCKW
jgi:hypothetical protein